MPEFTFVVNNPTRQNHVPEFDDDAVLPVPVLNFGAEEEDTASPACSCHRATQSPIPYVMNTNPVFDDDALLAVPVLNFETENSQSGMPHRTTNTGSTNSNSQFGSDAVLAVPAFRFN